MKRTASIMEQRGGMYNEVMEEKEELEAKIKVLEDKNAEMNEKSMSKTKV